MKRDFLNKYSHLARIPKSVLRNIYKTLTGDSSSSSCSAEKDIDDRVIQALLDLDVPQIVLELNGNPNSTRFDIFWDELAQYLEDTTMAVDERRHTSVMHMPIAISVHNLRDIIVERLQKKHSNLPPVPSLEWIRLQFWPSSQYANQALRYTGHFQVKYAVQVRQLRKEHPDSSYVGNILKYVKEFAVLHKSHVCMLSVDDKAIVHVGEPGAPVSTGVRGHNKSLVTTDGPKNLALDHDFHVFGIVPSVAFMVDIPNSAQESFFQGKPYVTVKDKVTQPSSALRHSCELKMILEKEAFAKSILITVSDGGPDHRVTFPSVKLALIALFRALDLDMLVSVRTCPYQSWTNMAERVLSTLNIALQNTALARKEMDEFEEFVRSKNTLGEVRQAIAQHPGLDEAIKDSMSRPILMLCDRFKALSLKDEPIRIGFPATDDDLKDMLEQIRFIEPNIESEDMSTKDIEKSLPLQKFFSAHCHMTNYVFQIKKCFDSSCFYCNQHPVRMSTESFAKLAYLPLPLLDTDEEHFQPFNILYGQTPSDINQPSKGSPAQQEAKEIDKSRKNLFVNSKVRNVVKCQECYKPRCVYALKKLTSAESALVEEIDSSKLYIYFFFQYYSATLVSFPSICFYCGAPEETLVDDSGIQQLCSQYAVVRPICFLCRSSGKRPATRQPNNMAPQTKHAKLSK